MGTDVCLTCWSRLIDLLVVRHVALVESLDNTAETDLGSGLVFDIGGFFFFQEWVHNGAPQFGLHNETWLG